MTKAKLLEVIRVLHDQACSSGCPEFGEYCDVEHTEICITAKTILKAAHKGNKKKTVEKMTCEPQH